MVKDQTPVIETIFGIDLKNIASLQNCKLKTTIIDLVDYITCYWILCSFSGGVARF